MNILIRLYTSHNIGDTLEGELAPFTVVSIAKVLVSHCLASQLLAVHLMHEQMTNKGLHDKAFRKLDFYSHLECSDN